MERAPFGPVSYDDGVHVYWAITIPSARWNGFLCPHFSPETAVRIAQEMADHRDADPTLKVSFEGTTIVFEQDGEEVNRAELQSYDDGTLYYEVGAYSWMWGYAA